MVDNRVTTMIQELSMRLEQQGMKMEQYLQYAGTDIARFVRPIVRLQLRM